MMEKYSRFIFYYFQSSNVEAHQVGENVVEEEEEDEWWVVTNQHQHETTTWLLCAAPDVRDTFRFIESAWRNE